MLGRVWRRRGEAEDLDGPVVTRRRKVLVCRVERDSLHMALVDGQCLQLLKRVSRPYHHF